MSNLMRCITCNGQKKYAPLGGIMKDCMDCKGIGFIESIQSRVNVVDQEVVSDPVVSLKEKMRGRRRNNRLDVQL